MDMGKFDICGEFKEALNLMEGTSRNIFITGKAGCGKSTLLRYFTDVTNKRIVTLAPTGIAAINVGGQTIHSFFNFPLGLLQDSQVKKLYRDKKKIINNLDAILIDEASMLRADVFDAIDHSLRLNRKNMDRPFGGVQVILFGDIFQLSPVLDSNLTGIMRQYYESPYFFKAKVMEEINLKYFQLNRIYRQKDKQFIDLLGKIRLNECSHDDLDVLNERVGHSTDKGHITLTTTNRDAERMNIRYLNQIDSPQYNYQALVKGDFKQNICPTETCLTLKKGARVMMLNNDKDKRWVNGTIAEIAALSKDAVRVEINGQVHLLERFVWQKIRYTFDDKTRQIDEEVVGEFKQYPLKLAWAITIHKSQGQTFDKVVVDIGSGAFSPGQIYVALSRCKSLRGVVLKKPIRMSDVIVDDQMRYFQEIQEAALLQ
jgi:ATP-dependent DNA helicase PIF1